MVRPNLIQKPNLILTTGVFLLSFSKKSKKYLPISERIVVAASIRT